MAFLGGLLGGGKSTVTTTASTTSNVSVNTDIANVIDTEPLAAPIDRLAAAIADGSQAQAVATLAAAQIGASEAKAAEGSGLRDILTILTVLSFAFAVFKGKAIPLQVSA